SGPLPSPCPCFPRSGWRVPPGRRSSRRRRRGPTAKRREEGRGASLGLLLRKPWRRARCASGHLSRETAFPKHFLEASCTVAEHFSAHRVPPAFSPHNWAGFGGPKRAWV